MHHFQGFAKLIQFRCQHQALIGQTLQSAGGCGRLRAGVPAGKDCA
jgi:hypothetical protein